MRKITAPPNQAVTIFFERLHAPLGTAHIYRSALAVRKIAALPKVTVLVAQRA